MRSSWRRQDTPLNSHAEWLARLDKKNKKQGTSAPTLASTWAGPVEVFGALHSHPTFADVALDGIVVEAQSTFDMYPGGRRNHDLVVHGHLPGGERVVACVEAKAGEDLGPTVEQFRKAAELKRSKGETTNAPERLQDLLARFVPSEPSEERVRGLRYQLLAALAGTVAEAASANAQHAVLLLHEFVTDQRPGNEAAEHARDLHYFCTTVFHSEPPDHQHMAWCYEVRAPTCMTGRLYMARAVTDLRTKTLEGSPTPPAV